jgi:hypothetical protein
MKYVFYLHSHITYFVAKLVIERLKLDEINDVKYIVTRNYKHSDIKNVLNLEHFNQYYHGHIEKTQSERNVQMIDTSVNELVENQEFELFIPSLTHALKQILITHKQCKNIHLIEEGLSNYFDKLSFYKSPSYSMSWHKRLAFSVYRRFKNIRVRPLAVYDLKKVSPNGFFYGLFDEVAPYLPKKNKVIFGKMYQDPSFPDNYKLENIYLVILDAIAVEQNKLLSEEEFLSFFTKELKKQIIDNHIVKIGIKFHPAQKLSLKESILRFLTNEKIEFFEIPAEISIEQMLVYGKNLTVIGVFSSLLFYAQKLGHQVFSLALHSDKIELIQFVEQNFPKSFSHLL